MEKPSEIKGVEIFHSSIASSRTGNNRELTGNWVPENYIVGKPDEIFDHKDSLVKTRSLAIWQRQLVIRHAQVNSRETASSSF